MSSPKRWSIQSITRSIRVFRHKVWDYLFRVTLPKRGSARLAVETLEGRDLLTTLPVTLFDTGVSSPGTALGDNQTDSHYSLVSPGLMPGATRTLTADGFPIGPWVGNSSGSRWVVPAATDGNGDAAAGKFDYQTTFDLTGIDPSTVTISGNWAADDAATVYLNGVNTGVTIASPGYGSLVSFSLTTGFRAGVNDLDFVVTNGGGPTGLRVSGLTGSGESAADTTIAGLFNTGVDNSGNPLTGLSTDSHWTVVSAPTSSLNGSTKAMPGNAYPFPRWVANDSNSEWVAPTSTATDASGPVGAYKFQTTFDLTGYDPSTVVLSGRWSADNEGVQAYLNGVPLDLNVTGPNPGSGVEAYGAFSSFYITNGFNGATFQTGQNTLEFVVRNDPLSSGSTTYNPIGLRVDDLHLSGTTPPVPPVPPSPPTTLTYSDTQLTPGSPIVGQADESFAEATVATFTDNDATRTADDYSATVDWGNGTVTNATVTGGSGSFEVQDTPPYDLPSVYGVTVTITANYRSDPANHSSSIVATREVHTHLTATVEAPPVTVTDEPMDATKCEPTENGVAIASFELPEGYDLSRYTAEVRMGDGSGIISGVQLEIGTSGAVEVLVPSHTYNTPGTYDAHVLIRDTKSNLETGGEVVGAGVTKVTVTDPDSSNIAGLESFPVTVTEAASSEKTVASFPVPSGESASNYSAAIDWGDGSPIVFVHGEGGGEFKATPPATNPIVSGVRISVYHDGTETGQLGGTLVGVIGATLTVEDAVLTTDTSVAPADIKRNANDEVSEFLLAAFTSDDSTDTADRYRALINWGDGTQSVADVLGTGGKFWVGGTHPFAETGTYSVTIRIQDEVLAGKQVWEAQDTIQVLDIRQGADFVGSLGMAEVQPADASGGAVEGQVTWNDPASEEGDARIESQGPGYYEVLTPDSTPSTPPASPPGYLLPDDYSPSIEVTKDALSAGDSWTVRAGDAALSVAGDSPTGTIDAQINVPTPVTEVLSFTDPATSGAGYTATVDWGDGTQDVATVVEVSDTEFRVDAPAHTYTAVGNYPVSVLVSSLEVTGGGAATLLAKRVVKVDDPDVFLADQRRDERDNATWVSAGPMSQVSENTGAVRVSHQLDFDQNPGTTVGRDPHLVYNSATVNPRPVIEGTIPMTATPGAIAVVTLTWDGVDQTPKTLVVPADYTGQWVVSAQPDEPASEGVHAWTMSVSVYAAGANPATDEALNSWTTSGQAQVVDNTASQFGAGWNLDLNWRIVPDADGVGGAMLVYGTGESRYFPSQGLGFANPPEEFGTLTSSCDGFEYRSKFGEIWDFDPLGRLTTITDRNGLQTVFTRDSGTGNITAVTAIDGNTVDIDSGSGSVTFNESGSRTVVEALSGSDVGSITDPGGVRVFGYSDDLLTSDTWGTRHTDYDYDANGMARDFSLGTHTYDVDPAAEWGLGGIDITTSPVQAPGTGAVTDARTDATTVTLSLLGRSKKTTFANETFTTGVTLTIRSETSSRSRTRTALPKATCMTRSITMCLRRPTRTTTSRSTRTTRSGMC
ncbi:MAG: RHS repeat protein [Planctomycetes bacterium]|nr:RHS repeat protein [Planctomycetota bacterium]